MADAVSPAYDERRNKVLVGNLPDEFLRLDAGNRQQQEAADEQTAMILQQQVAVGGFYPQNVIGKLHITVVQAELVKNYGVTRMDPYCRLRIGHTVYETHTDHNGARNPRWNKVIQCYLSQGVTSFYLEIFDECTFTMDDKVAFGNYPIPESVFSGSTVDEWFPLSGKQGDEKEGRINFVLSFTPIRPQQMAYAGGHPMVVVPAGMYGGGIPYYVPGVPQQQMQMQPQPPPPPVVITDQDIDQIHEMFPNVEREVVKSILEVNKGDKSTTINALILIGSGA